MQDVKCSAEEARERALALVGSPLGLYVYGTGSYHPGAEHDTPSGNERWETDCAGFALSWAWKLDRHRPGFNAGPWASVSDDINCNSALEDAAHRSDVFTHPAPGALDPRPGDVLVYPTFRAWGAVHIGHCALVLEVESDFRAGRWDRLVVAQAHGPTGFSPGVVRTDGSVFLRHDWHWPRLDQRTKLLRPRERA